TPWPWARLKLSASMEPATASSGRSLPLAWTWRATSSSGRLVESTAAITRSMPWPENMPASSSGVAGRSGRTAMPALRSALTVASASSMLSSTTIRRSALSWFFAIRSPPVPRGYAMSARAASIPAPSKWAFGRVTGHFPDQPGHQVAGQPPAQRFVQRAGAIVRDLEMGGAGHPVELVQVVGQHAGLEPALPQPGQGVFIVVDPAQQHRLVEQGGAGAAQHRLGRA